MNHVLWLFQKKFLWDLLDVFVTYLCILLDLQFLKQWIKNTLQVNEKWRKSFVNKLVFVLIICFRLD